MKKYILAVILSWITFNNYCQFPSGVKVIEPEEKEWVVVEKPQIYNKKFSYYKIGDSYFIILKNNVYLLVGRCWFPNSKIVWNKKYLLTNKK